ncbi:MAG: tRNA adenosine(34) deaminase TadA [Proteobacteria bacterium]|nr:tRNA adenosine(34) deaminase TadA [Pseudomonadota bacterium]
MIDSDQQVLAEDRRWMRYALGLAATAFDKGEVPIGAVVVLNGEIIGEGYNQPIESIDPTAHAEVVALRDAAKRKNNYRLPGACVYVTVEPCTMCVGALIQARIERLVIGAPEPKTGAVFSQAQLLDSPAHNHRIVVTSGVREALCRDLMTTFFQAKRKPKESSSVDPCADHRQNPRETDE